jgi:hypothetical protein
MSSRRTVNVKDRTSFVDSTRAGEIAAALRQAAARMGTNGEIGRVDAIGPDGQRIAGSPAQVIAALETLPAGARAQASYRYSYAYGEGGGGGGGSPGAGGAAGALDVSATIVGEDSGSAIVEIVALVVPEDADPVPVESITVTGAIWIGERSTVNARFGEVTEAEDGAAEYQVEIPRESGSWSLELTVETDQGFAISAAGSVTVGEPAPAVERGPAAPIAVDQEPDRVPVADQAPAPAVDAPTVAELRAQLAAERDARARLEAERDARAALEAERAQLAAERAALEAERAALERARERAALEAERAQLAAERAALEAERAAVERVELEAERVELEAERAPAARGIGGAIASFFGRLFGRGR